MKSKLTHIKKPAFTFVELMFAIIFLGVLLTMSLTIIFGTIRFYYFANTLRQNQASGRELLDTISRDVRFGTVLKPDEPATSESICIVNFVSDEIVSYKKDGNNLKRSKKQYNSDSIPDSATIDSNCSDGDQINDSKLKVTSFEVGLVKGSSAELSSVKPSSATIKLKFATGNVNNYNQCDPKNIYCNELEYTTAVNFRN